MYHTRQRLPCIWATPPLELAAIVTPSVILNPPPFAHPGVCCPDTNITVEVSEKLLKSPPGGGGALPGGGSSSGGSSGGLLPIPKLPGGDTPSIGSLSPTGDSSSSSGGLPPPTLGVDAPSISAGVPMVEVPASVAEVESGPVHIKQGAAGTAGEATATAQCPRMPLPDEPGYTTICRHDNTSNLQVCNCAAL